jgi:hypothetical protein
MANPVSPEPNRGGVKAVSARVAAGLGLFLGVAGLLLSLAGAVGAWLIMTPVTDRATALFGRVKAALDLADRALGQAKASLARASARLDGVRQEQEKLAGEPRRAGPTRRLLAWARPSASRPGG